MRGRRLHLLSVLYFCLQVSAVSPSLRIGPDACTGECSPSSLDSLVELGQTVRLSLVSEEFSTRPEVLIASHGNSHEVHAASIPRSHVTMSRQREVSAQWMTLHIPLEVRASHAIEHILTNNDRQKNASVTSAHIEVGVESAIWSAIDRGVQQRKLLMRCPGADASEVMTCGELDGVALQSHSFDFLNGDGRYCLKLIQWAVKAVTSLDTKAVWLRGDVAPVRREYELLQALQPDGLHGSHAWPESERKAADVRAVSMKDWNNQTGLLSVATHVLLRAVLVDSAASTYSERPPLSKCELEFVGQAPCFSESVAAVHVGHHRINASACWPRNSHAAASDDCSSQSPSVLLQGSSTTFGANASSASQARVDLRAYLLAEAGVNSHALVSSVDARLHSMVCGTFESDHLRERDEYLASLWEPNDIYDALLDDYNRRNSSNSSTDVLNQTLVARFNNSAGLRRRRGPEGEVLRSPYGLNYKLGGQGAHFDQLLHKHVTPHVESFYSAMSGRSIWLNEDNSPSPSAPAIDPLYNRLDESDSEGVALLERSRRVLLPVWRTHDNMASLLEASLGTREAFGGIVDPVLNIVPPTMTEMLEQNAKDPVAQVLGPILSELMIDPLVTPLMEKLKPLVQDAVTEYLEDRDMEVLARDVHKQIADDLPMLVEARVSIGTSRKVVNHLTVELTHAVAEALVHILMKQLTPPIASLCVKMITPPISQTVVMTVTNALKRSPRGDVTCHAECTPDEENEITKRDACAKCQSNDQYNMDYFSSYYTQHYGQYYAQQYGTNFPELFYTLPPLGSKIAQETFAAGGGDQ